MTVQVGVDSCLVPHLLVSAALIVIAMKFFATATLLAFVATATARPFSLFKRDGHTGEWPLTLHEFNSLTTFPDVQLLNFALTLEHLENAFYSGALQKFADSDFEKAGFQPFTRGRFTQIAAHEASHVQFLTSALASAATKPCNYSLYAAFLN